MVRFAKNNYYSHDGVKLCFLAKVKYQLSVMFVVCFAALRPKSTAMVMAGRSVLLTTLFSGQA